MLVIARYKSKDYFQSSKFVPFKVLPEVNGIGKEVVIKITNKHLIHTYCVNKHLIHTCIVSGFEPTSPHFIIVLKILYINKLI